MKIKKQAFQNMINHVFKVEGKSVNDMLKESKRESTPEHFKQHVLLAQSYLKGLERAMSMISTILKEIDDEDDH